MCKKFYDSIKMLVFYIKMKVCTCFLLLRIFAYTNPSPLNTTQEDNRGRSLDLKVVLELDLNENSKNVFVATNKTIIDENKIPRHFRASTVETFTDFIQRVGNILNTYEDTALTDFFDILDEEIRKYHYRGCKFYELTENYEFRSLIAEKLDLIKKKSVPVLKADINEVVTIIRDGTYGKNVKELLDYINSLYREDAGEKFRKVLADLNAYGNSRSERIKIIRDSVQAIVFNHYTDLNINDRQELKKEIAIFLKKIKAVPSTALSSIKTNLFPYRPALRESENTVKISGYNIAFEDENPELSLVKIDPTLTADNKIFKVKASDEKHQEEATKLETSKEERKRQQVQIIYLNADESSDETVKGKSIEKFQKRKLEFNLKPYATLYTEDILSYKNTEKPKIILKSEMRSNLVQGMFIEISTGRLPTVHLTTTPEPRLMREEVLRRSQPPPMPEEELSIDIFDREEKQRQRGIARSNRNTITVQDGVEVYIQRIRNLRNKVNELKQINEYNQNNKMNVSTDGNKVKSIIDQYETKDKKHKDKNKREKSKKIKKTKHVCIRESYEDEVIVGTKKSKNKVREKKRHVTKTKSMKEDEQDLEKNKETVKKHVRHGHKLKKQQATEPTKTDKKYKGGTDANDAETSEQIRVRASLPGAKNNAGNTTVNDNPLKLTKTTSNVTEKVKDNRINNSRRYRKVLDYIRHQITNQLFDGHSP